jgi:2-polyprenyl-6-methoxyphenol hydroxylase-like FAD-dependent oxidoreductase
VIAATVLIVGGGIAGLTAAIALRQQGHTVTVIERDPNWSVYGVGIIQQANVIRAVAELGILDEYLAAAVGFDTVEIFAPDGTKVARVPAPRLVEGYPANVGIGRPALHRVLGTTAQKAGAVIRLGSTVEQLKDNGKTVQATFSDGTSGVYDFVVGADGAYSKTRGMILPQAEVPQFTGQAVWRYNFPRPVDLDCLQVYNGPIGVGLVPISSEQMYMFVTTPEPDKTRYSAEGLAAAMRNKLAGSSPTVRKLAEQITDDAAVVYRPLDTVLVTGPWHNGRVVLLGDAVHSTTPHLGQGAGMAIEDSLVLARELASHDDVEAAFTAFRARRFERCAYIVNASLAICHGQIGRGPPVDNTIATAEMFAVTAQPI